MLMIKFGCFYRKNDGTWAVDLTTREGVKSTMCAEKKGALTQIIKARDYKFNGQPHNIDTRICVLWSNYPKYACYIGLTPYGIQLIGETNSDTVTLYGNGVWRCDHPEAWPKYIVKAMNKIAKKFDDYYRYTKLRYTIRLRRALGGCVYRTRDYASATILKLEGYDINEFDECILMPYELERLQKTTAYNFEII